MLHGSWAILLALAIGQDQSGFLPTPVRPGMSTAEVRQLLGQPVSVTRQLLYRRHIEQWVYENPQHVRVQFNCVRGEEPVVTTVLRQRSSATTGK